MNTGVSAASLLDGGGDCSLELQCGQDRHSALHRGGSSPLEGLIILRVGLALEHPTGHEEA